MSDYTYGKEGSFDKYKEIMDGNSCCNTDSMINYMPARVTQYLRFFEKWWLFRWGFKIKWNIMNISEITKNIQIWSFQVIYTILVYRKYLFI